MMADGRSLLAFSQIYPPYVGGSGLWVHRLVQSWPGPVATLCQEHPLSRPEEQHGKNRVRRIPFNFPSWAPDTMVSIKNYWTATRALKREIKDAKPAVILCGRGIPEGVVTRWVCGGVPYVNLAHGEEIVACLTSRKLKALLRYSYRGARLIIANSHNTRKLAIQAGADPERCVVIPPGVDAASLERKPASTDLPWKHRPGAMVVATVGRLEPRKNQVGVIQAVAKLVAQGKDIHYVIAGAGIGRGAVEQAVADHGLQAHVTLLGEVPDGDVRALYHACDVFAMPSIQHGPSIEGFGIVFLEAASAGKPSIAGTAGGSSDAVVHGATGLVVDGTSVEAIAEALAKFYDRPDLRHTYGRNGQQRARREFDWAIVLQKAHDAILTAIS